MRGLERYLRPLVVIEERMPWFLPVIGAVFLGSLGNLLYDVVKNAAGFVGALVLLLVLLIVGVAFVALYALRIERLQNTKNLAVADKPNPEKYAGLIILVGARAVVEKAIDYHLPVLEHCWLVVTPQAAAVAAEIQTKYQDRIRFHPREIANEYDTDRCYALVGRIFAEEAPGEGLDPKRVIADMTGGTKPMTAAMVLACLAGRYAVEHVPAQFKKEGDRYIPQAPLDPIQIVIETKGAR